MLLSLPLAGENRKDSALMPVEGLFLQPASIQVACVANALNLLYIAQTDYTNGLDECVGRLHRRLPYSLRSKRFRAV